jgi:hypothetical protein
MKLWILETRRQLQTFSLERLTLALKTYTFTPLEPTATKANCNQLEPKPLEPTAHKRRLPN